MPDPDPLKMKSKRARNGPTGVITTQPERQKGATPSKNHSSQDAIETPIVEKEEEKEMNCLKAFCVECGNCCVGLLGNI